MSTIRQWIQQRPLVWFFGLAYALCAAAFLSHFLIPLTAFSPVWLIGVFSPTIAALLVAGALGGWPEVRRLLSGYTRWRIGWQWYLAAASLGLAPLGVTLVYIALGHPPTGPQPGITAGTYLILLGQTLLAGPLAEETGWRGFAQPRMQARWGALRASLLLGGLWAFWHVPQYLVGGGGMIPFPIFLPLCLALAVLFAWVFNNTRGSLVATTLMHFSFNFAGGHLAGHLGLVPPMVLNIAGGVGLLIGAILVAVIAGPHYLSRKPVSELPMAATAGTPAAPTPPARPRTAGLRG